MSDRTETTQLLADATAGNRSAVSELFDRVYAELHRVAQHRLRSEPPDVVLQPTVLVHDSFLQLIEQSESSWQSRTHFVAVAARSMHRFLVDQARERNAQKRGGHWQQVYLDGLDQIASAEQTDILDLSHALEHLAILSPRQAEIVELRFFGGMTMTEIARHLNLSKRTVETDWAMSKAWLKRELSENDRTNTDPSDRKGSDGSANSSDGTQT